MGSIDIMNVLLWRSFARNVVSRGPDCIEARWYAVMWTKANVGCSADETMKNIPRYDLDQG
jgi:hypothetical protein